MKDFSLISFYITLEKSCTRNKLIIINKNYLFIVDFGIVAVVSEKNLFHIQIISLYTDNVMYIDLTF